MASNPNPNPNPDTDPANAIDKPIVVRQSQGVLDTAQTVLRLLVVILSTAPGAVLLLKKHDLVGLYDWFHTNQGAALLGALSGLAAIAYGIYKSYKRGAQVATVAASNQVPESVAQLK